MPQRISYLYYVQHYKRATLALRDSFLTLVQVGASFRGKEPSSDYESKTVRAKENDLFILLQWSAI